MTEPRAWILVVIVLVLGVPSPLCAQSQRPPATTPCAFDTASHSATFVKQLGVVAYRNRDTVPDRALTAAFGAVIQPNFVPPPTIGMLAYPGTAPAPDKAPRPPEFKSELRRHSVLGVLHLRVTREGVPQEVSWELITYDPPTENEVVRQLTTASGTADLRSIGAATDGGDVRLHLEWLPDSSDLVPLLRMRVAVIVIDEPVKYLDGPLPRYPFAQRQQGIEGMAVLRYVVDESGKPVPGTMRVIAASGTGFMNAAIDAISKSRFQAGRTAGCSVPMLVEQVVRFHHIGRGQ
jgi:TonB family protein